VPLTTPTPKTKYTVKTLLLKNIRIVYLMLTGKPLGGERCPTRSAGSSRRARRRRFTKRGVRATLSGYSWSADASDLRRISTKGMARRTKFTWYTRGGTPKVLLSKTITVY
jgi:hypothetical protein